MLELKNVSSGDPDLPVLFDLTTNENLAAGSCGVPADELVVYP